MNDLNLHFNEVMLAQKKINLAQKELVRKEQILLFHLWQVNVFHVEA